MRRPSASTLTALVLAIGALQATPALAQRVFVAAQGSDANPCTFALPCRTFQRAHDTAAAGGEIDVLDPAGYGTLIITKAISIQGHGFAGISVGASAAGITINASAADAVSLNGLLIDGSQVGNFGILFSGGKSLSVATCVVRRVQFAGLAFRPSAATPAALSISDSHFTESDGDGIAIQPTGSAAVRATIARVVLHADHLALDVSNDDGGPLDVAVADSVASGNAIGIAAFDRTAGHVGTSVVLTRTTASGNDLGIETNGLNSILRLARSTITGNTIGYFISEGMIFSYGDNLIAGNGHNTGTLGSASRQ
jgi:hypothetical protein